MIVSRKRADLEFGQNSRGLDKNIERYRHIESRRGRFVLARDR